MLHSGHFVAIGAVLLALALVIGAYALSFQFAAGDIYGGLWANTDVTSAAVTDANLGIAREGVRWAQTTRYETTIWAVVLFIFAAYLMLHHWGQNIIAY